MGRTPLDYNEENRQRAILEARRLLQDRAKEEAMEQLKKKKVFREGKKVVEDSPTLQALGAITAQLAEKRALEAEKNILKGEDGTSLKLRGTYDPRTDDKGLGLFFDKSF